MLPRAKMNEEQPFSVRCEQRDGAAVVVVTGEVDMSTSPMLREGLRSPEAQAETVVLDLRAVTFMDSSGLGAIVGQHKRAREHGFRFAVAVGARRESSASWRWRSSRRCWRSSSLPTTRSQAEERAGGRAGAQGGRHDP